jgi:hypothetical protein
LIYWRNYPELRLPKKLPQGQGVDWEVVIVDATDIEIERPQKNSAVTTVANTKRIRSKPR